MYYNPMFENKVKKVTHRVSTTKSTSRNKVAKKQLIQALYTDTTGLKTQKSKSQCLSREKDLSRKSIQLKKVNKISNQKFATSRRHDKQFLLDCSPQSKSRKPSLFQYYTALYDNIVTQKAVQLKWGRKTSLPKKKQIRSVEKERKQWDESKVPYTWQAVILNYSYLLTKYEQSQIKEYKKIYYTGYRAKKTQKVDFIEANFDNEQKQYNFLMHDHIAYRFQILALIGKGSYGQVFRVFDHKHKEELALKMIKNRTKFSKQAFIQIQILTHIKEKDPEGTSNIIKIKDFVIFRKHVCIVFQLMSENLYELIIRNNYNGLNLDLIRRFAIQILTAIQFLRKHTIIHCDLKPENILLKEYHRSGIKIIDFGSSCFENQTIYTYIQSRYYRAPQITLGVQYDCKIDIWSTGCILGELFTGVPLFPGENQNQQMKYFVNTLGPPPQSIINKGSRAHHFFEKGVLKKQITQLPTIQYFSKTFSERIGDEGFRNFLQGFLKWDPKMRVTPLEALKNKWIVDGMPEDIRFTQFLAKQDQKQASKTVGIAKSKSKEKKSKLSFTNIHSKKLRQSRQ